MTPLEELAAKLRTFWLRDISASSASVDGSAAADGSIAVARTLFIPAAGGLVGINQIPTDPYALDVAGHGRIAGNLYARAGNSWNIGADGAPWGAIYASDLHVGNLIAENKIATTGGRILVSPSTKVILAMTTGATTIDVAANTLTSGDRIYLESTGKLEWMAVTSGSTAITNGYRYSVTRNLNGAGAQTWSAGDAVVNTGQTGQGFIDLYSRYGIPANGQTATTRQGPTIVGNVRTGSTFDAIKERWAVGNLKGLYDYAATAYGLAAGDPTAAWISVDATNGIRLVNNATVLGQWTAAGAITIGEVAAGKSNVAISSGQLDVRNNATNRISLTSAGILTIRNSSGNAVFTFDSSAGAEFTLPLSLAATGGIYQGTGTFASPTTGLKIWHDSGIGRIAGYNSGNIQWYADTDGYLKAGGVWIGSAGITLGGDVVQWSDDGTPSGTILASINLPFTEAGGQYWVFAYPGTGSGTQIIEMRSDRLDVLNSHGGSTGKLRTATIEIVGSSSGTATIVPPAAAGTPTLTLPTASGTFALTSDIPAAGAVSTKTANYTTTASDGTILVSASTADITIDLLSPAAYSGKIVHYKKIDTSAYYVRLVARTGTVETAHALNLAPNASYAAVKLQSDGSQWWVVSAVGSYTLTPASGALWALNWHGQGSGIAGAGINRQRAFGRGKQYLFGQSFGGR